MDSFNQKAQASNQGMQTSRVTGGKADTLEKPGYRPRLIEARLDSLMQGFGCVEINGAKWCGKTWTALSRAASKTELDRPAEREAAEVDPSLALIGKTPHLVDEWQEVPSVWDAARRYVDDADGRRGLLLLTGSSTPRGREDIRHSGTGRIARLTMRPMTLVESGESTGEVSLRALLEGSTPPRVRKETSIHEIARLCCRGGWPANLGMADELAMSTAVEYVKSVADSVKEEGRSAATALALMKALALNAAQAVTYKTLAADMSKGENSGPDENTIASYLDLLKRLHLIEELNGWEAPMRSKARVRVKPKRYFVDPSLPAALLSATPDKLVTDMQTLGLLFETLVLRELRVFLSSYPGLGNGIAYYRDDKNLEVDAIVEYGGGWAGIEMKLSDAKVDEGAKNLIALREKILKNPKANGQEPLFLAVVVGKGSLAYQREDGVLVIPATTLGA